MNIEEYLNNATDPVQIVSDLIEDLLREYEENPLTVAYENNRKKFEELQYIEPDDFLLDMMYDANHYIYSTYSKLEKIKSYCEEMNKK